MRKQNAYGVWGPSSVKKILHNQTYTGIWYYNKTMTIKVDGKRKQVPRPREEWIEVSVPAIIDTDTFEVAQTQLYTNKAVAKRNTKHQYLLQGMVYCVCGLRCHCTARRELYYYKCKVKGGEEWKRECSTRFGVRTHVLESLVWDAVTNLLLNPAYLQEAIAKQRANAQGQMQSFNERLEAVEAAIADTKRKIGILVDQMLDEAFPKEVVEERRGLLMDKLSQLQSQHEQVLAERATATITQDQEQTLLTFADSIRKGLEQTTFEHKRTILQILKVRVDALDKERVKISGFIPFAEDVVELGSFVAPSS